MLLKGYAKEIFRPECNPSFQSLHCIAHLDQDVSEALPYLNAFLGGFEYLKDPPAVTFRVTEKSSRSIPEKLRSTPSKTRRRRTKSLSGLRGRSMKRGKGGRRSSRSLRDYPSQRF